MVVSMPTVHVRDTIELDETEEKICERLLGTLDHHKLKTELRVAGGWVRDKVCIGELIDLWGNKEFVFEHWLFRLCSFLEKSARTLTFLWKV